MLVEQTVKKYDTYKDSGIEWIGEIPQEWTVGNLKRLTDFIKNGTSATQVENETEYKVSRIETISTGEINYSKTGYIQYFDNIDNYRLNSNDILFSNINSLEMVGNVAIYDNKQPLYSGMNLLRISINKSTSPKWLFYVLRNSYFVEQVKANAKHAINQVSISVGRLSQIPIIIPSKGEQQRIAEYLDKKCGEIDKVVETEKAVIELLKEYKQSVITEAVTKGLDKSVPLKDSGIEWIGKIPQHWEVTQISKLYNIILGKMLCTKPISDTDTLENYLCSANIKFEGIKTDEIKQMYFNESEKKLYLLNQNDVLISEGGDAGTAAIYNNEAYPCYIQNAVHKATAYNKQIVLNKFLYYWMFFCKKCGYIDLTCNKATIMHYTKEKVSKTPIVFISRQEQQQIAEYLDKKCSEIDKVITGKEQLIEKLTEYKKSLIYECVTGKRKVV